MKKMRFGNLQDYLALAVRQKWWIIVPFLALSSLLALLSTMLPMIYLSETMIMIQPRDVPSDFVKDLIAGSDERLGAIEQTILSRTSLLKIVSEFESGLRDYRGLNNERKIDDLKKQIKITFTTPTVGSSGRNRPITNFRISYRNQNPELAQKITARVAALFIDQDRSNRTSQVYGTTEFLTSELKKVADQLAESEGKLKQLKEQYRFELPSQLETNLRTLDRLQLQRNGNLEALDRLVTMQLNLERQISETPAMLSQEVISRNQAASSAGRNPQVETYKKKEQEYKELLTKVTERHPDVQRLQAELDQLKKDIPPEDLVAPSEQLPGQENAVTIPNPAYQSLVSQLRGVKTEIEIRQREKKTIDLEMAKYTQRVQNTPRVEQEVASVFRVNSDLSKQYEELKNKQSQAKLAESLESRQQGSQFLIIDPANYPLEAATPSKSVFILFGSGISLAIGFALAFVVGSLDSRVRTQPELERFLGTAVLVEIPKLTSERDIVRARRRMLLQAGAFLILACVYGAGLYVIHLKQTTVMRLLNPVMDKLMSRFVA